MAAAAVHITTGLWFAVLIGVAIVVLEPALAARGHRLRPWPASRWPLGAAGGPLHGRLVVMDDVWLQAVASKDSLFAIEWPLSAWAVNLGTLGVLWVAHRCRAARGRAGAEERALVWGATALVALFLITLPAVAARVAFPVQLQISRVFWLVDFVATACLVGALAELAVAGAGSGGRRWRRAWRPWPPAAAPTSCSSSIPNAPLFESSCPPRRGTRRCSGWRRSRSTRTCSPIPATRGATARASA